MDNKKFSLRIISIILTFSLILTSLPMLVAAETQSETEQPIMETTDTTKEQEATIIEEVEEKREPNVKHFLLSDGTYTAAVYDEDVHILEDDGTYSEIDNSLIDDGSDLKAKNGKNDIKLSNNTNSSKLVKMKIGDYKISWNFEGINKTKSAKIKNKETKELTGDEKHLTVTNTKGYAYFENAFDNVDLEYIIGTNSVKENIILKQKGAKSTYVVEYNIDKLTAVQTDSKTITLYDGENPVFTLSAPVMTDSAEQSSNDLALTIVEQKNKKLTVKLSANEEWLNSNDRVYPVTLDPVAIFKLDVDDITYKYTYSNANCTDSPAAGTLFVGYSAGANSKHTMYSAVKINKLPTLQSGDMVYNADFVLHLNTYQQKDTGKTEINVDLHRVNANWSGYTSSSINVYGTGPSYDSTVIDYNKVSLAKAQSLITWDITTLVKQWYGGVANNGIVLRPSNHATTDDNMAWFASPANAAAENNENRYPAFVIYYINHKGLEDYWSFTSQDLGTSGASYVNNYTGNLVLNVPGIETLSASLPAGVSLYYNALQDGHFQNTNCGYGWKLNYDIKLSSITAGTTINDALRSAGYYYTIEDADGTVHYMKSESNYAGGTHKDEDGLGWTLKYSSTGDPYTLTDKENNKWTFNSRGRIIGIYTNQSYDKITFTYDSTGYILQKITDGAGHTLTFTRNQYNSVLKITDDTGKYISWGYSGAKLTSLTYPDGETISFAYNSNNLLSSVTLRDGRHVKYEYITTGNAVNKYRVKKVTEYSMVDDSGNRTSGNYTSFSYGNGNFTNLTDTDGKKMTYNFDTLGRPTSVMDETGAVSVNYNSETGTNSKTNKVDKGTTSIRPVDNLVNYSSFESGLTGWGAWNHDGVLRATSSTAAHMLGTKSICFSPTDTIVNSTLAQSYVPIRTGDYTFSFYYKINEDLTGSGGIKPIIALIDDEGAATYVHGAAATKTTNGEWERLSVTANVGDNIATIQGVIAYQNAKGTVYIDCAQLEYGPAANEYNMITNSCFEKGETGWTRVRLTSDDAVVNASSVGANTPSVLTKAFKFKGDAAVNKQVMQDIPINLPANQVAFSISGYACGNSIPVTSSRFFGIDIKFYYTDGSTEYKIVSFNSHNTGWQYASELIVPKENNQSKHIEKARIYLLYYLNRNTAAMSGINLYIDKTGAVYNYDDDGNVTSAKDTADRKESVNYDDYNRVTSYTDALGNDYFYVYNSDNASTGSTKYQLKYEASVADRIETHYTYDSHGNVIQTSRMQERLDNSMVSNNQYSVNGDRLLNTTDNLRTITTYGYDTTNTNDLRVKSITKNGSTVNYTYKPNSTVVTGVSANVTGIDGTQRTVSNTYSYVKDRLTSITHNGFNYNLTYDLFGNRLATLIGNRTLMTNQYEPNNGNLIKSTYGNGAYTENVYDEYDRVTAVKQNGTTAYKYTYDAKSRINRLQDLVNNKTYNYTYDMIGRATAVDVSDGSRIKYTYNNLDQTTKKYYKYNGTENSVNYTYQYNGSPKTSTFSKGFSSSYSYEELARKSSYSFTTTGNRTYTDNYSYYTPTVNGTTYETTLVSSITNNASQDSYAYTYDANGNITSTVITNQHGSYTFSYVYDELGQLIRVNDEGDGTTYLYGYDSGGNIIWAYDDAYTTDEIEFDINSAHTYTYGDAEWKDLLTAYDGNTITYDQIGNPLEYKNGEQLTWQNGRQLATVSKSNGTNASYKYNESGIRVQKTVNNRTYNTFLDGSTIIAQDSMGGFMWFYYDNAGKRVAVEYNGEIYYYLYNLQGDVTGLLDENLNQVVSYYYNPWGELLYVSGSEAYNIGQDNPFLYRGYFFDAETGFYYLNSRYYDPETGRFINADGFVSTGQGFNGNNMFVYCGNNPTVYSDEFGTRYVRGTDACGIDENTTYTTQINLPNIVLAIDPRVPPDHPSYTPPKGGAKKVRNPNGNGKGWQAKNGGVWVPTNGMHGGDGWTVQYPNGGHEHAYPGGKIRKSTTSQPIKGIGNMGLGIVLSLLILADDATGVGAANDVLLTTTAGMVVVGWDQILGRCECEEG